MANNSVYKKLVNLLHENSIDFRLIEHECEGRSQEISRIRGNHPSQAMKALVVSLKGGGLGRQNTLAVLPGNLRLNMKSLCKSLGAKKGSFVSEEKALELTDCVTGAIPPFSFHDQLKLVVDNKCQENEEIVFNAGRLDRSIFMKFTDYKEISDSLFCDITDFG